MADMRRIYEIVPPSRTPRVGKPAAVDVVAAWRAGRPRGVARQAATASIAAMQRVTPRLSRRAALALVPPESVRLLARQQDAESALLLAHLPAPALASYRAGALTLDRVLSHLPYDLALKLLKIRAEGMREFFAAWAASLALNAKLDKESAQRAHVRAAADARVHARRQEAVANQSRVELARLARYERVLAKRLTRTAAAAVRPLDAMAPPPSPLRLAAGALATARPRGLAILPSGRLASGAWGILIDAPVQPYGFRLRPPPRLR